MKFNISAPPHSESGDMKLQLERLESWLYILSERLNAVLANLGKDNFSADAREKLFGEKEEKDDNT